MDVNTLQNQLRIQKEKVYALQLELAEVKAQGNINFKKVFDAHWPVIAAAKRVKNYYAGVNNQKTPIICSDVVGKLIEAIIGAEKSFNITLKVEEIKEDDNT